VIRLSKDLQSDEIEVVLTETKLNSNEIYQSNAILFNKISIEEIFNIKVLENYCDSC